LAAQLATQYPLLCLLATMATQFLQFLRNLAQIQFPANIFALVGLFHPARYVGTLEL
jgi:hypothetical protein